MKDWIKSIIQDNAIGFLSIVSHGTISTHKVPYRYDRGHLKIPVSILYPELIEALKPISTAVMLILDNIRSVELSCEVNIDDGDLDKNWEIYSDLILDHVKVFSDDILVTTPSLCKQVIADLKPYRIQACETGGMMFSYELEIL